MSDTIHSIYIHVIFGTKKRVPYLPVELAPSLYAYMGGIVRNNKSKPLIIGGHRDHIHMLVRTGTKFDVSELVKESKRASALWMKQEQRVPRAFGWQRGFAAFSVSHWDVERVTQYIANQEQHHRRYDFGDELKRFWKRYGISGEELDRSEWVQ